MRRSGYNDDYEDNSLWLWRGAVAQAIRGKRGQQFLRDLVAALDAIPSKRLIANELEDGAEVCALGSVGKMRGISMTEVDPYDRDEMSRLFGIAPAMAAEIMYENDEGNFGSETPEARWERVRRWATENIKAQS